MRRYLVFGVVSLILLLSSINGTAVAVAFPVLTSELDISIVLAAWILNSYQLIVCAIMPLAGKAADSFGRKRIFVICLVLFTAGSLLSAVASNAYQLIFFRAIQAIGGGGFLPCCSGIVVEQFPKNRQTVLGLFTSIFPIGQIIGPNLGGWVIETMGWRMLFWAYVPVGVFVLIMALLLIKWDRVKEKHRLDLAGAGLFSASLLSLLLAFGEVAHLKDTGSAVMLVVLLASAVGFFLVLLRRERRVAEPIIDLALLTRKEFLATNIFNIGFGLNVMGVLAFIPLYAVSVYGMTTLQSGFIVTPRSVTTMIMSTVCSFFLVRWGYRKPILIGSVIMAATSAILAFEFKRLDFLFIHLDSTGLVMLLMAAVGFGFGLAAPASNNACIELMPDKISTIAGLRGMFRQSGGALAISLGATILDLVGDYNKGFAITYAVMGGILLLLVPLVFLMPDCAREPQSKKPATQPGSSHPAR